MNTLNSAKIAIVKSLFRREVTDNLEKNCLATLKKKGLKTEQVDIFNVPGSLEIPLVVKKLAKKGIYSAIFTFGAIVKGDTITLNKSATNVPGVAWRYLYNMKFQLFLKFYLFMI